MGRDRRLSSEPKPSRRVLTPRPSLASTHPRSACTPSTSAEPTPGPTTTGRSFTRVAGRLSEPSTSSPPGRRSTTSSPRDPPRSCPSGLVRGPARRRETPRPQRVRRMLRLLQLTRSTMKRRRRMRRNMTRRKNKLFLYFNASMPFDLLGPSYSYILDLEKLRNIPDWLVVENQSPPSEIGLP